MRHPLTVAVSSLPSFSSFCVASFNCPMPLSSLSCCAAVSCVVVRSHRFAHVWLAILWTEISHSIIIVSTAKLNQNQQKYFPGFCWKQSFWRWSASNNDHSAHSAHSAQSHAHPMLYQEQTHKTLNGSASVRANAHTHTVSVWRISIFN